MWELAASNVLAFVIGLATCFLSWWLLFHVIAPKVEFSDNLSRLPTTDDGASTKWRFNFTNSSKRGLIDVQISARLSIKGLQFPDSWSVFRMPLDSSGDLKYEIPLVSPNNDRVIRMFPGASRDIRDSALMPPAVREAAANGVLRLEDLLVLGQAASVTVYVLGYDEFSGARRLFKSKHYRLADVTDGTFQGLRVVGSEVTTKHSAQSNEEPRSGA